MEYKDKSIKSFIGRKKELAELNSYINKKGRSLIALIGRRGVGKTRLKNEFIKNLSLKEEFLIIDLRANKNFKRQNLILDCLTKVNSQIGLGLNTREIYEKNNLQDWLSFFLFLKEQILIQKQKLKKEKIVIAIDEFAWFQTKQSNFVEYFAQFYDEFQEEDIMFLITASSISWMNKNVLKTKGGLYHKVMKTIKLKPFNLLETIDFLKEINPTFSVYEYMQYYLYTGGVARYLDKIVESRNILENVKNLFINTGNSTGDEFEEIFHSAFEGNVNLHIAAISAFKEKNSYSKIELYELLKKTKKISFNSVSSVVDDLVVSDILSERKNFGKDKREKVYFISDLFCYYCLKVFKNKVINQALLDKANIYNGYAFELFCFLNADVIKKCAMRNGFESLNYSWRNKNSQIDLIFDYGRNKYSIVECKNYNQKYSFTKEEVENLLNKKEEFSKYLYSKNQRIYEIDFIIVSMYGIKINDGRLNPIYIEVDKIIEENLKANFS